MKASVSRLVLAAMLICGVSSLAFAQGGSAAGTINGTVVDSSGGVIPGATVDVVNLATNTKNTVVTNSSGVFQVPALEPGNYSVTVSLQGFKTYVIPKLQLLPGGSQTPKVVLEIGQVTDTVRVEAGAAEMIKTNDTNVTATISADQINDLPLITRNALNYVTFLPGVNSGSTHSQRSSTILGLPQSTIAITIDGVNAQDQGLHSTDGFFAVIRPQTDLVEEVTVSEATPGADASGQGAVQIKFVTRSGSNQPNGSVYENLRHPSLNTNSFFNTPAGGTVTVEQPKNPVELNQYGFRQGGPIVFPHLFDGRNKAFYFVNYEELRLPSAISVSRTVLNPLDLNGTFFWSCQGIAGASSCGNSTNLMALAAKNGQSSTIDPTVLAYLTEINNEQKNCPVCFQGLTLNTDQNTALYSWQPLSLRVEHLPGGRADFNLSTKQRLSFTYDLQKVNSNPDTLNSAESGFPGGSVHGAQTSWRNLGSATLRSTLTANMVNEAGWGMQWAPVSFSADKVPSEFDDAFPGGYPGTEAFSLAPPTISRLDGPGTNIQARNGSYWAVHDTLSWLKGSHSISTGVTFTQTSLWNESYNSVPSVSLSVDQTNDPAASMFSTANFAGASTTELGNARNIYALLDGRVTSISQVSARQGDGSYIYGGIPLEQLRQREVDLFAQDQWRLRPNVTVNAGVRYALQFPVYPLTSVYGQNNTTDFCGQSGFGTPAANAIQAQNIGIQCNFGTPTFSGPLPAQGTIPVYEAYSAGSPGYHTDTNNYAPSVGLAWQPNVQHGFMRTLLGDPALATIRASYGRAYNQGGLFDYTSVMENAPGLTVNSTRSFANGNLPVPILLTPSLTGGLFGPPGTCVGATVGCVPTSLNYPTPIVFSPNSVFLFDPSYQTSYTDSYSIGLQRSINRDTALEIRYVGTRNNFGSTDFEFGEQDILNNPFGSSSNFLSEFKDAQQNLVVNDQYQAAHGGKLPDGTTSASYAYFALPGQSPLPIMVASFDGVTGCGSTTYAAGCPGANNPANYVKGANTVNPWTNTTYVQGLSLYSPSIGGTGGAFTGQNTSSSLFGVTSLRNNGLAAGLPLNFWVMNPDVMFDTVQTSQLTTSYNSLQLILTRRLSHGLQVSANYVYQIQYSSSDDGTVYKPEVLYRSTGSVPNAFKFTASWDIPVGRGKRYGTDMNKWVNGIIGNWNVSMTGRVENGRLIDIGDVRLVGLSLDQLQSEFKYYRNTQGDTADGIVADGRWYELPLPLIANTLKANSIDATSVTGYQICTGKNSLTCGGPNTSQPYIAPASDPATGCLRIYQGDCGTRDQFLVSPMFTSFDFSAKKRFPFARHGSFDVEVDILNVFNAIDFNASTTFASGTQGNYQVTSAYSDVSNTFDPGGRLGQLVFRVNW